jgi:hypothetical protein
MGRHEGLFNLPEIQTMINAGFVDFLFTGAAILPEVLMLAGYVGEGMLLMIPLLIAACLVSMYQQQVVPDASSAAPDAAALGDDTAEGEARQI